MEPHKKHWTVCKPNGKKSLAKAASRSTTAGILVVPAVVTLILLGLYPLVFTIAASVSDSNLGKPFKGWAGFENFADVLGDGDVVASLGRTVGYALLVTVLSVTLGLITALALYNAVQSGSIVRTLILLPLIVPPVIVGILWKLIYNPSGGLLATVLGAFGANRDSVAPLTATDTALPAVALADIWEWSPLVALLIFTALLAQDRQTLEAAQLDGASGWQIFRHITFPAISGVLMAAFFIRLILAFKVFDLVFVMTTGGPGQATTTTSFVIYQMALKEFDIGRASAVTLLFAVIVTLIALPVAWLTRKLDDHHG